MNNINLIGRLTADVELKQTQSGIEVCSFSLAVRRPKLKGMTDFINCVAWRNTAKFISQYFKKGNLIAVSGVLTSRKYQDNNGNNRTVLEVVVDEAEFCESKGEAKPEFSAPEQTNFEDIKSDEDLPF